MDPLLPPLPPLRFQTGFTIVELVVVLLIVGLLAAVAGPRMFGRDAFDQRGFADQVRAALQFARKSAVAQRRDVCAVVSATGVSLRSASCGGSALTNPATGNAFDLAAPQGVALSPAGNVVFDALGRLSSPTSGAAISVTGIAAPILVERETGYVH